jgi:hypothetical protein
LLHLLKLCKSRLTEVLTMPTILDLGGIGDLIMAGVTGHGLSQVGGNPYQIVVKSAISIT